MNKFLFSFLLLNIPLSHAANTVCLDSPYIPKFQELDKNHDGTLSRNELSAQLFNSLHPNLLCENVSRVYDTDKSGSYSNGEYTKWKATFGNTYCIINRNDWLQKQLLCAANK
jgi:hypothetical protein